MNLLHSPLEYQWGTFLGMQICAPHHYGNCVILQSLKQHRSSLLQQPGTKVEIHCTITFNLATDGIQTSFLKLRLSYVVHTRAWQDAFVKQYCTYLCVSTMVCQGYH